MSDIIPNQNGKLSNFKNDLKFRNDFGETPLLLGHFTLDQGFIAVASVVGAFVGAALAGPPLATVVAIAGLNDIIYARKPSTGEPEAEPEVRTPAAHAHPLFSETRTPLEGIDETSEPVETTNGSLVTPPPVPSSPAVVPMLKNTPAQNTRLTPVDVALEMARIPKSTIIAASPRVGKGVVVSMAIAHLRQLHPDLEIWLIDPKDEPTERHYWAGIDPDKRCHFDLRDFDVDVEAAVEVFSEHLTRFNRSPSYRKLLIIDEFVTLNQKCAGQFMNQLKDFIVGICSSGEVNPDMGIGRFVWGITQSPYVSDIGFKTKAALATFQRVFLLNKASVQLYQLAVSASFVPAGFEPKINRLLEPTGRIFYYSRTDSWHAIPIYNLPNCSGDSLLRAKLEGLISGVSDAPETPADLPETSETPKQPPETPKQPPASRFSQSEEISAKRFTKLKLPFREAKDLVKRLRNEMSQTKLIEALWEAKPGESKAYKDAISELKMLTDDD